MIVENNKWDILYLMDLSFERQLSLLNSLSEIKSYEAIIWFYPDSKIKNFLSFEVIDVHRPKTKPATTYSEDYSYKLTRRIKAIKNFLPEFRNNESLFRDNCDAICLYEKENNEWDICIIPHEKTVLVKNDVISVEELYGLGFSASSIPPGWW